jgi:hypothetical protein
VVMSLHRLSAAAGYHYLVRHPRAATGSGMRAHRCLRCAALGIRRAVGPVRGWPTLGRDGQRLRGGVGRDRERMAALFGAAWTHSSVRRWAAYPSFRRRTSGSLPGSPNCLPTLTPRLGLPLCMRPSASASTFIRMLPTGDRHCHRRDFADHRFRRAGTFSSRCRVLGVTVKRKD